MHIRQNSWYENSVSVERGPLVYALKIGQEIKKVKNAKDTVAYGSSFYEVRPLRPGILASFIRPKTNWMNCLK